MIVAACRATLYLAEAASLKDKRRVVRSVCDRLRARCNASVCELDESSRDLWQRAELAVAIAARGRAEARSHLARALAEIESASGLKHIEHSAEYH